MTLNMHEHVARIRKVNAIVGVLGRYGVTAYEAERFTEVEQAEIAALAGVNAPSPKSWAAVVARLAAQEGSEG